MPEIENEVTVTCYAENLSLSTTVDRSTVSIRNVVLDENQAASLGYLINNPRNIIEAQIKLVDRIPLP